MTPEFSRPIRIDTLGDGERAIEIEANEGERVALATRFGLLSLDGLSAEIRLHLEGDVILAEGRIRAQVDQPCVASGVAVPASIDEPFTLRCVPAGQGEGAEIELHADEVDTIDYEGNAIDLGEMVAETLALSLNPFPRSPDADAVLKEAGVLSEEEAQADSSPFAALRGLKDKL